MVLHRMSERLLALTFSLAMTLAFLQSVEN